ncbi:MULTISPECIES: hypothetical protein [unclassified Amycolatopsis]|uniref:hypothetical protein n=1 Tax=unclassified Amycolatopsis TaxID=2618356 RepID=UPI0028764E1D|nr:MULTISPECIES: hypothetical protein [unclassified Amycolatopsis]MDS0135216.1 hypothetical protein [Amycolatopsis sp. 505]MDS0143007.1 hypothetical protein [Amycolatopsis sp. CM201R]
MGQRAVREALASGLLAQPWRGVVMRSSDALKLRTRAEGALLAVGRPAVLSGPTSLALHGVSAAECADIHITVPYERRIKSKPGLVVHQGYHRPTDVIEVDGLATFPIDLALAEFLCDGDRRTAFAALDECLRELPSNHDRKLRENIRDRLDDRRDRRGIHRARTLLELATGKAESPPESWLRLLVVEAGFPVPEPQYELTAVDGRLLYRLDMAWPSRRIALEYDGYAAHEDRKVYDAERDARIAGRGWLTIRAIAADLRDSTRLLKELDEAFRLRSA